MARRIQTKEQKLPGEMYNICKDCHTMMAFSPKEVFIDLSYKESLTECVRCPECGKNIVLSFISTEYM